MKALFGLFTLFFAGTLLAEEPVQVPFGDKVGSFIVNYNRTTPFIATSGAIDADSIDKVKALGFKSILDIRTPREGVVMEQKSAEKHGLAFENIPVGGTAPTAESLARFTVWIENKDNYPTLVHCASANRVGLLWGMYRVQKGVSLEEALGEAKTIGMKASREQQLIDYAKQSRK